MSIDVGRVWPGADQTWRDFDRMWAELGEIRLDLARSPTNLAIGPFARGVLGLEPFTQQPPQEGHTCWQLSRCSMFFPDLISDLSREIHMAATSQTRGSGRA